MIEKFSLQRSMTDKNVSLLLEELYSVKGNYLIIADENWAQTNWTDLASRCQCELHIISNRYDVAQQAEAAGLSVTFNDLDFSHLENHYYDGILFRVCKERASSHHVINHAFHLLKPQGSLLLSGNKMTVSKRMLRMHAISLVTALRPKRMAIITSLLLRFIPLKKSRWMIRVTPRLVTLPSLKMSRCAVSLAFLAGKKLIVVVLFWSSIYLFSSSASHNHQNLFLISVAAMAICVPMLLSSVLSR